MHHNRNPLKLARFLVQNVYNAFIDFIAPNECYVCGALTIKNDNYDFICNKCLDNIPIPPPSDEIKNNIYSNNGAKEDIIRNCYSLIYLGKHFEYINLIYQSKYYGKKHIGFMLGKLLAESYFAKNQYDAIIPIPLHKVKFRERGYNQSEIISKGIAQVIDGPVMAEIIKRRYYTITQTKLSYEERKKNLDGVFEVDKNFYGKEMNVLLVDDVLTTGSTIYRCAELLKQSKTAENIDIATLAYA